MTDDERQGCGEKPLGREMRASGAGEAAPAGEQAATVKLAPGARLVLASHNPGKLAEFQALFAPYGITLLSAGELGLAEPEETGASFAENARLKAVAAAEAAGLPALADDSGLEVAALGGAPGIYSARWAGPDKDFTKAMARVEQELQEKGAASAQERRANFTCALCLAMPGGAAQIFEGRVFGHITWPPRGTRGFGYDPIFVPDGYDITFGEMAREDKDRISHRARAFAALVAALLEPRHDC